MQTVQVELPARKRQRGQRRHHRAAIKRAVPINRPTNSRTPLDRCAMAYYLWHASYYPGITRGLFELFGGRVKPDTIKKWRQGKRKAPVWALALLREAIEKQIAELEHARALLTANDTLD